MKKLFFLLLLFFAIIPSNIFAQEKNIIQDDVIQKFLSEKLKNWKNPQDTQKQCHVIEKIDILNRIILDFHDGVLHGTITFSENKKVQPIIFVSYPEGQVEKFFLPKKFIAKNGIIKNLEKISFSFSLLQEGKYQVEFLDESGFSIINQEFVYKQNRKEKIKKRIDSFQEIIDDINYQRKQQKVTNIQQDIVLQKIAKRKIEDMTQGQYVGHTSIEGKNIGDFANQDEKLLFSRLGENVAGGNNASIGALYNEIINSPAHKYFLVSPLWKKIGMAYDIVDGKSYFVQVFSD